jgi:hypothetical protein
VAEDFINIDGGTIFVFPDFRMAESSDSHICLFLAPMTAAAAPMRDLYYYGFAVLFGVFACWFDLKVSDLLFTALLVLAPCMLLGALRPERPWRWVAIISVCVPVAELLGYLLMTQRPDRAQIYESFLAFLPGIAGAYGGAMLRRVVNNLFQAK